MKPDLFNKVPTLVELSVRNFHGVSDLTVPWDKQMVLLGANGAGKTTILRALALACGDESALLVLASSEVDFNESSMVSVVIESDDRELLIPELTDDYWALAGLNPASTWAQVWETSGLPSSLVELMVEAAVEPTVRWDLVEISGLSPVVREEVEAEAGFHDYIEPWPAEFEMTVSRRFDRTLMVNRDQLSEEVMLDIESLAGDETLPEAFRPHLNSRTDGTGISEYVPLLTLPPSSLVPPIDVSMCGTGRTPVEFVWDIERLELRCEALLNEFGSRIRFLEGLKNPPSILLDTAFCVASEWPNEIMPRALNLRVNDTSGSVLGYRPDHLPGARSTMGLLRMLSAGEFSTYDVAVALSASRWNRTMERVWRLSERLEGADSGVLLRRVETEMRKRGTRYLEFGVNSKPTLEFVDVLEHTAPPYRSQSADFPDLESSSIDGLRPLIARRFRGKILLIDEPEKNLHPSAELDMLTMIETAQQSGNIDSIAVSSHSHRWIGRPGWTPHLIRKHEGAVTAQRLDGSIQTVADDVAEELGLTRGELLSQIRKILFVEGPADRLFLEALFADRLEQQGVLIIPFHGTYNAPSLSDLSILDDFLQLDLFLMSDRTRQEALQKGFAGERTGEEEMLFHLDTQRKKKGRPGIKFLPLTYSDISAYLDDEVIREVKESWPGWDKALPKRRGDPKAVLRKFGVDPNPTTIARLARRMKELSLTPHQHLLDAMSGLTQR